MVDSYPCLFIFINSMGIDSIFIKPRANSILLKKTKTKLKYLALLTLLMLNYKPISWRDAPSKNFAHFWGANVGFIPIQWTTVIM